MARGTYAGDREWTDRFKKIIERALSRAIGITATIRPSMREDDIDKCIDYEIYMEEDSNKKLGICGSRIRQWKYHSFQDWTIRSYRKSGARTELEKIKEGHCPWYFYGYLSPSEEELAQWLLIDVLKVLKRRLLDNRETTINPDGITGHIQIPFIELEEASCIVVQERTGE